MHDVTPQRRHLGGGYTIRKTMREAADLGVIDRRMSRRTEHTPESFVPFHGSSAGRRSASLMEQ
jgi:hypothetical protein